MAVLLAAAADDRRVVGRNDHLLGRAEVGELHRIERHAEVLENGVGAGQHGDVAEHGLAAVAVAGRLHRHHVEDAAQLVDDQRGQRLALDVLGDNQQRLAGLADRLQQRDQVLRVGNLVLVDQDQALLELDGLLVLVRDEMRREEAAVELHALDHVDGRLGLLAFLDRDDAVLADLDKGVGQHVADRRIVVAGDGGDLGDFLLVLLVDRRGHLLDRLDHGVLGGVDAAAQGHRVGPGGDHPQALEVDRLGQQRGGRGAVAGDVGRLRGRFLDQLGAEILERIVQFDFLGHGHAVLGDFRRAPALVEHGVSAAGAKGADHGPGQLAHPGGQRLPSFVFKDQLFCHSGFLLLLA